MTLEEAKEFYFQYDGHSFHMDREEPARFNSFRMLEIGKERLREWDEELLDRLFRDMWSDPERIWITHGRILKILQRKNCDMKKYLSRLLDEMEKMDQLETDQMTLIIENMAGRNEKMSDGGVCLFCSCSDLAERMKDIEDRLIESCLTLHGTNKRFDKAIWRCRRAYDKWSA